MTCTGCDYGCPGCEPPAPAPSRIGGRIALTLAESGPVASRYFDRIRPPTPVNPQVSAVPTVPNGTDDVGPVGRVRRLPE